MPRWIVATAVLAGLACAAPVAAVADADTTPAERADAERGGARPGEVKRARTDRPEVKHTGAKRTDAKRTGAKRADAKRADAKRGGKTAKASRKARVRANGSNMPRGFTWPPSKAMLAAEAACERELDDAEVAWKSASAEGHIARAVTIEDATLGGIAYVPVYGKGPYKLDCQLALALHTIGPDLYAAGVREVHFGSIYRWSNVRVGGKTLPALSRHALGLAMDVVSFVDDTGRVANVARDYPLGDPLLDGVERAINASSSFRLLLTPNNDPISHRDHFHLEANPRYAAAPRS
jgi:hypothetical protein